MVGTQLGNNREITPMVSHPGKFQLEKSSS